MVRQGKIGINRFNSSAALTVGLCLSIVGLANAKDLTWTGKVNTTWDASTANWSDGTSDTAFADGDNVTVNTGSAMTLGATVAPGTVLFNLASDLTLTFNEKSALSGATSFEKRGNGMLTLSASGNNPGVRFYGPIDIQTGTLKVAGSNSARRFSDFSTGRGTEYVVENGARMIILDRNSIGSANYLGGSAATVRVKDGGTLQFGPDEKGTHCSISNLFLEGGSLDFRSKAQSNGLGYFGVLGTASFSGTTPYNVTGIASDNNAGWSLPPGAPVRFEIADISDDENVDVTFSMPFKRSTEWYSASGEKIPNEKFGFIKSGSGRLKLAALSGVAGSPNGDITVEAGVLEYTQQDQIRGEVSQTFTVRTNATLRFSMRNAIGGDVASVTNVKTRLVIDHGNFVIDDPAGTTGHTFLGEELTLDHATFTTTMGGYSEKTNEYGALTLGRLVSFAGDEPYDFSPFAGMTNPRVHLGADPLTEIRVADITGDAAVDVTNGYTLCDRCFKVNGAWTSLPGGFVKTGVGTFATSVKSSFHGNIEVREGTLMMDKVGFDKTCYGANTSSFLGDVTTSGRTITVSTNGVLEFAQRNIMCYYTYGDDGGNKVQTTLVLKGGTLRIADGNTANPFGSITVDGGTFEYGEHREWGAFNFRGTFKVTGDKPLRLPAVTSGASILPLYPLRACTFEIDDVTGDGDVDFSTDLALTKPPSKAYYDGTVTNSQTKLPYVYTYGFTKTGAGTMALNRSGGSAAPDFDDVAQVDAGTMLVNCDLSKAGAFAVAAGAAVGGTGTVHSVTLAEGAGLAATAGQAKALTVAGNLALPSNGTVDLRIPSGVDPTSVRVKVICSTGTLSGQENLANWTLRINGDASAAANYKLSVNSGEICVSYRSGFMLIFR